MARALALLAMLTLLGCNAVLGLDESTLAGADTQGVTRLALGKNQPQHIVVDKQYVYWTDLYGSSDGSTLTKVPLAGGPVQPLASVIGTADGLTVDSSTVYWTTSAGDVTAEFIGGGAPYLLNPDTTFLATGIAVDTTSVYLAAYGAVLKMPLAGGNAVPLATGQDGAFAIAVDATNVYWLTKTSLMKLSLSGGKPEALATGLRDPFAFAINASSAYWTSDSDGTIMRVPLSGGSATVVAFGQDSPRGIALDATSMYWVTAGGDGSVMKVGLGGGVPEVLAIAHGDPFGIAVDDSSVYWTNQRGFLDDDGLGSIEKVALK